jgi:hypothetical protein
MGLLGREMFIEEENLNFPMQEIDSDLIKTITGKNKKDIQFLSVFGVIGFVYGLILFASPFFIQAYTGSFVQILPLPWIDLNTTIERFFPGASLGIIPDILAITGGFILPFRYIAGIVIGSFAVWFFGNWFLVSYNITPEPWWSPGMPIVEIVQKSNAAFWFAPMMGIGIAAGVLPLIKNYKLLGNVVNLRKLKNIGKRVTDPVSIKIMVLFIGVGLIGRIAIYVYLVPEFVIFAPWYIAYIVASPFILLAINGRILGETGIGSVNPGSIVSTAIYFSAYDKIDIWFASSPAAISGVSTLSIYRVAQKTETKVSSIWKTFFLLYPVALLIGYGYTQLFWSIAPIPSGRYPGVQIFYNIQATNFAIYLGGFMGTGIVDPMNILYGFIIGSGLYVALLRSPIPFIALFGGFGTYPPSAIAILTGAILAIAARRIFKVSDAWWMKHRTLIAAGLTLGTSIAVAMGLAVSLVINSIWALPY